MKVQMVKIKLKDVKSNKIKKIWKMDFLFRGKFIIWNGEWIRCYNLIIG